MTSFTGIITTTTTPATSVNLRKDPIKQVKAPSYLLPRVGVAVYGNPPEKCLTVRIIQHITVYTAFSAEQSLNSNI